MSDTRSTRRMGRKLRFAAAIVGAAIALPGLAVAGISDCTPGVDCPVFDPDLVAGPQVGTNAEPASATTDTPSSLMFRFSAQDQTMPVVDATYYVPTGWQFNFGSLRAAQVSDATDGTVGAPVTSCDQVYRNDDNDADDAAATLDRAENLAGGVGMSIATSYTRDQGWPAPKYGYSVLGPDDQPSNQNSTTRSQNPSLAFLNWDGTTANLCLYLYANTNRIASYDEDDELSLLLGPPSSEKQFAREHIIPVTIQKIADDPKFGWKIHFDTTSVYRWSGRRFDAAPILDSFYLDQDAMITDFQFYLNDISGGNWNQVFGQPSGRIVVSKTPATPGTYEFRGDLSTCEKGFDISTATGCVDNALFTVTRSRVWDITPAPSQVIHTFGRLTGPVSTGQFTDSRFAVIRGSNKATVTWSQPPANPAVKPKGFVLAIANPNDHESRHIQRIITSTTDPVGDPNDARLPCGPTGTDATCSVTLEFPLQGLSKVLKGEGKYDISLATIWQDGYRTDNIEGRPLCDNGTALGALCSTSIPAPKVVSPGTSTWSIYITKTAWPDSLVGSTKVAINTAEASYSAPKYLMLLDLALKKAAFVDLNPGGGKATLWGPVTSNLIRGDLPRPVIIFDSGSYLGNGERFRFDQDNPTRTGTFRTYNFHDCPACQDQPQVTRTINFSGSTFS